MQNSRLDVLINVKRFESAKVSYSQLSGRSWISGANPGPMQRGDLRDNGAEINGLLWGYCQKARIRMSRSRPYKKNDNAWVEQRNWTHVRKVVGYRRPDSDVELAILQELYGASRSIRTFFSPR